MSDEDEEEESKSARYPLRSRNYSIVSDDTSDAPCTHLPLSQGTQYRLRSPILAATTRGSPGSSSRSRNHARETVEDDDDDTDSDLSYHSHDLHSDDLISDDADDDTSSNSSDDDISYESEQRSLSTPVSDDAEDFDVLNIHNTRQVRSIGAEQVRSIGAGQVRPYASGESYTSAIRSIRNRRWMPRG